MSDGSELEGGIKASNIGKSRPPDHSPFILWAVVVLYVSYQP